MASYKVPHVYLLEHLTTFFGIPDSQRILLSPEDGVRRMMEMQSHWMVKLRLLVTSKHLVLVNESSGEEIKIIPVQLVKQPTAFTHRDCNILLFTASGQSNEQNRSEMLLFRCLDERAESVVDDINCARGFVRQSYYAPFEQAANGRQIQEYEEAAARTANCMVTERHWLQQASSEFHRPRSHTNTGSFWNIDRPKWDEAYGCLWDASVSSSEDSDASSQDSDTPPSVLQNSDNTVLACSSNISPIQHQVRSVLQVMDRILDQQDQFRTQNEEVISQRCLIRNMKSQNTLSTAVSQLHPEVCRCETHHRQCAEEIESLKKELNQQRQLIINLSSKIQEQKEKGTNLSISGKPDYGETMVWRSFFVPLAAKDDDQVAKSSGSTDNLDDDESVPSDSKRTIKRAAGAAGLYSSAEETVARKCLSPIGSHQLAIGGARPKVFQQDNTQTSSRRRKDNTTSSTASKAIKTLKETIAQRILLKPLKESGKRSPLIAASSWRELGSV